MAMIYDMVTGRVIDDNEFINQAITSEQVPAPQLAVHTHEAGTPIEEMSPVDAYMVMLQDLLKKL
ncbi:MAG: hypothetical protein WBO34_06225 [Gammaproteobacteria bacterium]